jgi:hypothetical protein
MDGRSEGAVRTLQRRRLERGLAREQEEAGEGEARSSAASAHADMVARPSKRSLCGHWWEVGFRPLFGVRRFCWRTNVDRLQSETRPGRSSGQILAADLWSVRVPRVAGLAARSSVWSGCAALALGAVP